MIRAFIDGILAIVLAVVTGVLLAFGLAQVGLTETGLYPLGLWLAGVGLLGGWYQEVTSNVAGGIGWETTAAGAPLLVTGVVALFVAVRAKNRPAWTAAPAALGAAAGAALLVAGATVSQTTANAAGSVTTTEGLAWFWDGQRPGAVAGAAGLVALVWLLHTVGLRWWRSGRGVALGLLVGLGVVLTGAAVAGAIYLTSSTAVGIALGLLYPVAGTLVLFGLAGIPVSASLTRLTPQTQEFSTWDQGLLYAIGGVVVALLLTALVGLILRLFKHRSTWLGAVTVTAALAAFLAWAMSSTVVVPAALGAESTVTLDPLLALAAGAVLGAVTRFFAGRPKPTETVAPAEPAPVVTRDQDVEQLLNEVNAGPAGAPRP